MSCFQIPTFQSQDAVEYAECEAVVKDYPPFREAMKKRGVEDMDLLMVDAWLVKSAFWFFYSSTGGLHYILNIFLMLLSALHFL